MITTETPYKFAEIIRDTWPGLYRKPEVSYDRLGELFLQIELPEGQENPVKV